MTNLTDAVLDLAVQTQALQIELVRAEHHAEEDQPQQAAECLIQVQRLVRRMADVMSAGTGRRA